MMAAKSRSYPRGLQIEEVTRARPVPGEFKFTCWRCGPLALADPDLSYHAGEEIRNAADQFFSPRRDRRQNGPEFCITTGGVFGLIPGKAEIRNRIVAVRGDARLIT